MSDGNKGRFEAFDWLRGIAAFGIVGAHLNLGEVTKPAQVLLSYCNLNVGLFAALSGFLMAHSVVAKNLSVGAFIKSRIFRLLPIYAFWTCAYLVLGILFDVARSRPIGFDYLSVRHWASVLFQGGASCHLWFLICLIYAQILMGVTCISALRNATKATCRFLIIVGVLGVSCAVGLSAHFPRESFAGWFSIYFLRLISFLTFGMGVYGYARQIEKVHFIFGWALLSIVLIGHWYLRELSFLNDLLVVSAVLITALNGRKRVKLKSSTMRHLIAETSFGVYLVHPFISAALLSVLLHISSAPHSLFVVCCYWFAIWGISLCLVWFMKRIPVIKKSVI